jgi:putative chitinase
MILKVGSQGEDVKKLQAKLGLGADGIFGSGTEKAVKKWQIDHDLAADGIVGDGTWAKMFPTASTPTTVIKEDVVIPKTSGLNLEKLKGHIPAAVIAQIPDTAAKFQINTPLRLAHFLAQCGHESGGFKATQENLNYSAKGLMGIFKKYFPTQSIAEQYQRNPQKIASKVYGGRMGNGSESTGEGFKFRGRGYIQLTGKENYTAFGKSINEDIPSNPDKVATHYPLLSAAWFFSKNGLHKIADEGSTDLVVTKITKRVNGGTIGLADRIKHFKEYYNLLK